MKKIIKNILYKSWRFFRNKQKQDYLFLIGHPRSGSSLLMHILTSNEYISGFGEYLTKYEALIDLEKAEFDIRRKSKALFKEQKYIANQVNHHSVTPTIELLKSSESKIIFIIRKPSETLSSMAILSKKRNSNLSPTEIAEFYKDRLKEIREIADRISNHQWTFTTYSNLTNNPKQVLTSFSDFLQLSTPLTHHYNIQKYTQIWGDPSKNITKGKIINPKSPQIKISDKIIKPCEEVYQETLNHLNLYCLKN